MCNTSGVPDIRVLLLFLFKEIHDLRAEATRSHLTLMKSVKPIN